MSVVSVLVVSVLFFLFGLFAFLGYAELGLGAPRLLMFLCPATPFPNIGYAGSVFVRCPFSGSGALRPRSSLVRGRLRRRRDHQAMSRQDADDAADPPDFGGDATEGDVDDEKLEEERLQY